jgi:capsular polysaccharide biosynthesis protein
VDDPDQFASKIQVTNETNTRFVYISVTAAEPEVAEDIATEVATVSCEALNGLYAGADNDNVFKVYSVGKAPDEISNPVSKLVVLLIGAAAALVVYLIYLVIFLLDDKINGPEDVEKYLQLSVLGQIPNKQDSGRKKKYYAYNADSK